VLRSVVRLILVGSMHVYVCHRLHKAAYHAVFTAVLPNVLPSNNVVNCSRAIERML